MGNRPLTPDDLGIDPFLVERIRPGAPRPHRGNGRFVLYWMRTAVRGHENPALEVALAVADQLQLPVFVYHALSERYPYASDRHHAFILEGARDVQGELRELGIGYGFHLEREGHRGDHLRSLSARAASVVTEDFPIRFVRAWTERLADDCGAPLWQVDTSCIVPMRRVDRAYDRAFEYRRATESLRRERISLEWPTREVRRPLFVPDLPFDPVDLQSADLGALIACCEIDHSIGPVPHTCGGSRAGYARWRAFRDRGLYRYASRRNDPLRDGVSRMSAYLHYGHVSPFRIAREAAAMSGSGPQKYLDELLVWRELAYTFCHHRKDHDRTSAIPAWARRTLADHQNDPRPANPGHETLARAQTGDSLWDAAQRSLLIHGELHNNVRMTWGKALPYWTKDATDALAALIDLNHRYALDGRDPSSFGGILWCLGQFDRPFSPERPVLGSVRSRSTRDHARRIDVERYAAVTSRPAVERPPRIAVIGAGVSGLTCARTLSDHGLDVVVFDKGRRPGGRLATHTVGDRELDHGAQYFTVRDDRFRRCVDSWIHEGLVAEWTGRIVSIENGRRRSVSESHTRYVGVPEMNSVAAHLASDCTVRSGVRVDAVRRKYGAWHLASEPGDLGSFELLVVAVPAPQAAPLLADAPGLSEPVLHVRMTGCWSTSIAFGSSIDVDFDGAFVNVGLLSWVARNSSKPGRGGESWVLHATPGWTESHLELRPEEAAARMLEAFSEVAQVRLPEPEALLAHRWRYAVPAEPLSQRALFDAQRGVAVCGDWCGGPRVEGAFLSGAAAAGRILGSLAESTSLTQQKLFD